MSLLLFFLLFYTVIFSKSKMFAITQFLCNTIGKCICQREGQYYIVMIEENGFVFKLS